ncbi:MAG TPA: hypothetical protein VKI00_12825 [Mycobacterium sp.]|nr:hypothetical protein [Mycobacterium sp.]HME76494.1 hypothetical protein [Mycobacterium sp.]
MDQDDPEQRIAELEDSGPTRKRLLLQITVLNIQARQRPRPKPLSILH